MRRLTDAELGAAESALLGPRGDELRSAMVDLTLNRPVRSDAGAALARDLGWADADRLTELGQLVADPLRELAFYEGRNGSMASEEVVPRLAKENYAGKRVIELGSGGGCNLLGLGEVDGWFVGIDPMPVSLQMMPVLARLAGRPCPLAAEACAEGLPFADASFDIALCYSAHQYFDVNRAIEEMDRVVAPHGEVIIIGMSLWPFIPETIVRFARTRSLGTLKYDLVTILNTVWYQIRGRRLVHHQGANTTGYPIYPSGRFMRKRLRRHGFVVDDVTTTRLPSDETALFARRTQGSTT